MCVEMLPFDRDNQPGKIAVAGDPAELLFGLEHPGRSPAPSHIAVSHDMYGGCRAGVALTEIPRGEAWLGISELSPIGKKFSDQLRPRPASF